MLRPQLRLILLRGIPEKYPKAFCQMPRTAFLDTLALTDFGKIVCINLFRSLRVGTLTDSVVQEFLDACVTSNATHAAASPSDPASEIALRVVTDWWARAALVTSSRYKSPPGAPEPVQFATILPVDFFTRNASSAKHVTYSGRKISLESEFNATLKTWLADGATWHFGKDRLYFWMARPIDYSSVDPARLNKGLCQYQWEVFGLCHLGNHQRLVRALIPARLAESKFPLLRPNALDGIDNPAFRASTDSEAAAPPSQPGTALDLLLVGSAASNVDGQNEWLCDPLLVDATSVAWEFLGPPVDAQCNADLAFHQKVRTQIELSTPLADALTKLKNLT